MARKRGGAFVIFALMLGCSEVVVEPANQPTLVQNENLSSLLDTLRKSVGLTGDIAVSLKTQERIADLGRRDPKAVVPAIISQLRILRSREGKTAVDYQMALFSVLESIGPAAEAAVPVLTEIVQDSSERNDFVLLKARMALGAIGTPRAKSAGEAADLRSVDQWLQKASREDIKQAVAQQSYLIRRQLRSQRLSEEVIEVSVNALRPMGRQAADAVPALLRAWGDPRIGTTLRALIAAGLAAAGVKDVEAAAARLRAEGRPDPLAAIIGDTRSGNHLVSTLAMAELGDLGPSDKVIDALISALDENRNPGQAALVLGRFGTVAAKAIPSLLPHLAERESGANAIQALGLIGVRDGKVVSALSRIVADKSSPHRAIAVASLGSLRAVSALPELRAALLAPDKYTRILAANALGSFGAEAASAVPELSAMLEDPDTDVKVSAVHSLGLVGPAAASAVPRIARQLQHPDQRLKTAAVSALERIGGQEALAALELDARRYAEADRAEYLLQGQTTGRDGLRRFVDGLSRMRQVQLAHEMMRDQDAAIVSLAAGILIREGQEEETVPALAKLLLSRSPGSFPDKILPDLLESGDSLLASRTMVRICAYFESNFGNYSQPEQERIRKQICPNRRSP